MLTTATAQYVVADMLPCTSSLTILDKYIILAYSMLTMMCALNVYEKIQDRDNSIGTIDKTVPIIFAPLWVLGSLFLIVPSYYQGIREWLFSLPWEEVAAAQLIQKHAKYVVNEVTRQQKDSNTLGENLELQKKLQSVRPGRLAVSRSHRNE